MNVSSKLRQFREQALRLPLPARVVAAVIVGAATLLLMSLITNLLIWWSQNSQLSQELEPRISRTLGFLGAENEIAETLRQRDGMLAELAFADSGDSGRGGALLQQEIRRLSSDSGLTVVGSEVRESEALESLSKLHLNVKVAGQPASVTRFLEALDAYRPVLFVSRLSINPQQRQLISIRSPKREQFDNTLIMQLDIFAYQIGGSDA